ncbi:MAG: hypothetical protein Q7R64_01145 [bacterium]|nr:hypothetical protein [bacterium]
MSPFSLPISYLLWHYTTAWGDLLRWYRNLSWFLWNFFSIRILAGTLLSPWHRLKEAGSKETAGFIGSLIINLILRFIGFFARTLTILVGFVSLVLFSLFFFALLLVWPLAPVIIIGLIVRGIFGLATF